MAILGGTSQMSFMVKNKYFYIVLTFLIMRIIQPMLYFVEEWGASNSKSVYLTIFITVLMLFAASQIGIYL
jgi:hypothetical protein